MKRKISLFIAIMMLLTIALCSCNDEPAEPVARTDEEIYNTAMGYVSQGSYELAYAALLSIKSYDKAAAALQDFYYLPVLMTEKEADDKEKKDYDITSFTYDKSGNITMKNTVIEGQSQGFETFSYEDGLLKYSTLMDIEGKKGTSKYTFDGDGKLIEVFITDSNENFAKTEYKYDEDGKLSEEIATDFDGSVVTSKFSYGENGKILSKLSYKETDDNTETVMKCEYTYNAQGLLSTATKTAGDKKTTVEYSGHKLYYMPEYRDIMLYY